MCEGSMDQLYEHTTRLRMLKQNEIQSELVERKTYGKTRGRDMDRKKWTHY